MAGTGRRGGSRDKDDHDRDDHDDHEPEGPGANGSSDEDEEYDNPAEHLEIERRRFDGGLPPTPELYALAREQWYRLPGVLARPSMDPAIGEPASGEPQPTGRVNPDEKEPKP
ncbi:hypothetical protein [Paraburkholderia sacchari]|uniref:hypothetical protein n=1 Tax=Paraburkholderia sacchari TaxID=159450 RepID=UPI0039A50914